MLANTLLTPPTAASDKGAKTTINPIRTSRRIRLVPFPGGGHRYRRDARNHQHQGPVKNPDGNEGCEHDRHAMNAAGGPPSGAPRRDDQEADRRRRDAADRMRHPGMRRDDVVGEEATD